MWIRWGLSVCVMWSSGHGCEGRGGVGRRGIKGAVCAAGRLLCCFLPLILIHLTATHAPHARTHSPQPTSLSRSPLLPPGPAPNSTSHAKEHPLERMAPPSSRLLFLGLLLLSLLQGLQSLKDYHNIFCGKENCYDVLGVPQVSSTPVLQIMMLSFVVCARGSL